MRIVRALRIPASGQDLHRFVASLNFHLVPGDEYAEPWFSLADAEVSERPEHQQLDFERSLTDPRSRDRSAEIVIEPMQAVKSPPLAVQYTSDAIDLVDLDLPIEHDRSCVERFLDELEARIQLDPQAAPQAAAARQTERVHHWSGAEGDQTVRGSGADTFRLVADRAVAGVLVEDGATHALRTGSLADIRDVVVSITSDQNPDVDRSSWRRIALLSGVAKVEVEGEGETSLLFEGDFSGTHLDHANGSSDLVDFGFGARGAA